MSVFSLTKGTLTGAGGGDFEKLLKVPVQGGCPGFTVKGVVSMKEWGKIIGFRFKPNPAQDPCYPNPTPSYDQTVFSIASLNQLRDL